MERIFNWGIVGPGKIAHRFTEGLMLLENASLHAVGSRSIERAGQFAKKYGYRNFYGSYEELAADKELDIVYIASPHSHHMEHTLLCLEAGKSVICEKAFAINSSEVSKMISSARSKGLFLMEALWPPFQPSYIKAHEILGKGEIGRIMSVRSYFAFNPPYEPDKRLYNPLLGGGALLDIGIYPVIDALTFLGVPGEIRCEVSFDKTGVDNSVDILFGYGDGITASLYASLRSEAGVGTDLFCENGTISIRRYSDGSQLTILTSGGREPEVFKFLPPSRGFHLEAIEVMNCIAGGKTESKVVPLSFSEDLMKTLDRIRRISGIVYNDRE